jgi:hypothetical protein
MATNFDRMDINNPAFDRHVSLRDAYRIMERMVEQHVARGPMSTVDLLSYVGLTGLGESGDPAAFDDFFAAVNGVTTAQT